MATLDKLSAKKGKKKETGMNAAVASTEKIRHWVIFYIFFARLILTISPTTA